MEHSNGACVKDLYVRKKPLPESAYRRKLIEEVKRKLLKASERRDSPSQCQDLLRQLFTDVALEIDNRARALLYGEDSIASGGGKSSVCFYEILAEHYADVAEDGDELVPLFHTLWSLPFTSHVFALLMHQWLFKSSSVHGDETRRYSRAFINGLGEVLWIDVQSNSRRFISLFLFAEHDLVFNAGSLSKVTPQVRRDLVHLVCGFFFFYEPSHKLKAFISQLPQSIGSPFIGGASDVFVTELTNQLQKIKVEPVLLAYLESSKALKGIELRTATSIRLQVALYSLASPGGPLFPTRPVRHVAKSALDRLFPVGRRFRSLISFLFRILHPAYWPGSLMNFVSTISRSAYNWLSRLWPRNRRGRILHTSS